MFTSRSDVRPRFPRLCAVLWAALYVALYRLRRRDVIPFSQKPEPEPPPIPHHFNVDLAPNMRTELLRIVALQAKTGVTLAITEALELAHRIDTPFTPPIDWDALERKARAGYSVADQVFDWKKSGER